MAQTESPSPAVAIDTSLPVPASSTSTTGLGSESAAELTTTTTTTTAAPLHSMFEQKILGLCVTKVLQANPTDLQNKYNKYRLAKEGTASSVFDGIVTGGGDSSQSDCIVWAAFEKYVLSLQQGFNTQSDWNNFRTVFSFPESERAVIFKKGVADLSGIGPLIGYLMVTSSHVAFQSSLLKKVKIFKLQDITSLEPCKRGLLRLDRGIRMKSLNESGAVVVTEYDFPGTYQTESRNRLLSVLRAMVAAKQLVANASPAAAAIIITETIDDILRMKALRKVSQRNYDMNVCFMLRSTAAERAEYLSLVEKELNEEQQRLKTQAVEDIQRENNANPVAWVKAQVKAMVPGSASDDSSSSSSSSSPATDSVSVNQTPSSESETDEAQLRLSAPDLEWEEFVEGGARLKEHGSQLALEWYPMIAAGEHFVHLRQWKNPFETMFVICSVFMAAYFDVIQWFPAAYFVMNILLLLALRRWPTLLDTMWDRPKELQQQHDYFAAEARKPLPK